MAMYKRKPRCGYCYQEGHNRNSCPAVKQAAANGDSYAQERLERAKIKRCSYCRNDGHTKATCDIKFKDDHRSGWTLWAGINAVANIVREKKLANGAFVYGPIQHRWTEFPQESHEGKLNYEMINFCIGDNNFDMHTLIEETGNHFRYSTLAETPDGVWLKASYSIPGFYNAISQLDDSFLVGKTAWMKRNDNNWHYAGRQNQIDLCNVLVEAPQEEVDKLVDKLMAQKPIIVDYDDRKTYQSAVRAQNKKIKNELNDEED